MNFKILFLLLSISVTNHASDADDFAIDFTHPTKSNPIIHLIATRYALLKTIGTVPELCQDFEINVRVTEINTITKSSQSSVKSLITKTTNFDDAGGLVMDASLFESKINSDDGRRYEFKDLHILLETIEHSSINMEPTESWPDRILRYYGTPPDGCLSVYYNANHNQLYPKNAKPLPDLNRVDIEFSLNQSDLNVQHTLSLHDIHRHSSERTTFKLEGTSTRSDRPGKNTWEKAYGYFLPSPTAAASSSILEKHEKYE